MIHIHQGTSDPLLSFACRFVPAAVLMPTNLTTQNTTGHVSEHRPKGRATTTTSSLNCRRENAGASSGSAKRWRSRSGAQPERVPCAHVTLLGTVSDEELRWLYRECGALVATSHEDFGMTPFEAAGFGYRRCLFGWSMLSIWHTKRTVPVPSRLSARVAQLVEQRPCVRRGSSVRVRPPALFCFYACARPSRTSNVRGTLLS